MVIICLMMVNNNLLGGAITILKNDGVRQWEGWHPIYEMENKINVWNHQPDSHLKISDSSAPPILPQPNLLTIQQKTMETISQMKLLCLATGVTVVYPKQGVSKFPTNMVIETQKYGDVFNFVSTKVT